MGARVVDFDLPGHGGASLGEEAQTLQSCAVILGAVSEAAGLKQPTLFGQGFGGYLCLYAALQGILSPRAVILWQPVLGPPSWGAQLRDQLAGVAVDRLTVRTVESLWPPGTGELLETREMMIASARGLLEYARILAGLERLRPEALASIAPVHHLTRHQPPTMQTLEDLPAALVQLGLLSGHGR
jgi:pimeloyl-ACP methyl ester carboxylesterase